MAKYLKPKDKPRFVWLKVLLIILLVILLLVGSVVAFVWHKLDLIQYDDEIDYGVYQTEAVETVAEETEDPNMEIVDVSDLEIVETMPTVPEAEVKQEQNVVNILLIGTDERTKKFNTDARSDSMILVSIDKDRNTVKLVSLERGMGVPILEGQYEGKYDWLTHIFRYGGADLLTKTVEHCFKVEIDSYVRVNFHSVEQIVDSVGGIEIELTKAEAGYLGVMYPVKAGMNYVDGEIALSYARLREIDSDWTRVKRQRKVILAMVDALKGSSLKELNDLANEVLPLVQTDMSKTDIAEMMLYAPNLLTAEFDQMTIPKHGTYGGSKVLGGRSAFAVDFEENTKILHEFLFGTEE